jgi:hypothetical protein
MPGPTLDNLINEYIDTIPTFPKTVTSGNSTLNYYLRKHQYTDISLFTSERFAGKIKQVAKNQVEAHNLWTIANQVNLKAQGEFDKKNPL